MYTEYRQSDSIQIQSKHYVKCFILIDQKHPYSLIQYDPGYVLYLIRKSHGAKLTGLVLLWMWSQCRHAETL